jgi:Flp pilus assembly protein TadD
VKNDAHNELLDNTVTDWAEKTGEALFAQATQLARKGKYLQAERALNLLSMHQRPSAKVYLLLGKIYAQQNRYGDAIAQWQRALELEPTNADAEAAIKRAKQELQRT